MRKEIFSKILSSPLFPDKERDGWLKIVTNLPPEKLSPFLALVLEYEKRIEKINKIYKKKKKDLTKKHVSEWKKLVDQEKRKSLSALEKTSQAKDKEGLEEIHKKIAKM